MQIDLEQYPPSSYDIELIRNEKESALTSFNKWKNSLITIVGVFCFFGVFISLGVHFFNIVECAIVLFLISGLVSLYVRSMKMRLGIKRIEMELESLENVSSFEYINFLDRLGEDSSRDYRMKVFISGRGLIKAELQALLELGGKKDKCYCEHNMVGR